MVTPEGTGMGFLPIRDMGESRFLGYQTKASTSPPTPS
jgi:hypothetical protein